MSRTIKSRKSIAVAMMCAALAILPVQRVSAVALAEYGLLLGLIAAALDTFVPADLVEGSGIVVDQLQAAAEGARAANLIGNRATEVSRLSKAIGAAEALLGMSARCGNCSDFRNTLQQVIGVAALLKTSAVGASGSCQPNG